jgi:protein O-GlcNAc transferase
VAPAAAGAGTYPQPDSVAAPPPRRHARVRGLGRVPRRQARSKRLVRVPGRRTTPLRCRRAAVRSCPGCATPRIPQFLTRTISFASQILLTRVKYSILILHSRLLEVLRHSYLAGFDRGGVAPWALVQPHELLLLDAGGELFRSLAAAYAKGLTGEYRPQDTQPDFSFPIAGPGSGQPMVVGYVSSDFSAHATTHLLKGAFALHDKRSVTAVCLDLQQGGAAGKGAGSAWHAEVSRDCRLVPVARDSAAGAAGIRREQVQLIVDLNGWTAGHRGDVLAQRPAPIQALYLGYPATTGAGYIDYFMTDARASPPEFSSHYTEKLVLLPHCYYVNDHARYHAEEARAFEFAGAFGTASRSAHMEDLRASAGLPRAATLVANFNQIYKITPEVMATWMSAVVADEAAVFWQTLPLDSPAARGVGDRLRAAAGRLGLDAQRVLLTNNTNIVEFVRRCGLADLVLDTHPITAHTVAMDVLWMGTPLLTRTGESFSSRVATSVLSALGMHGILAARTSDDMRLIASRLLEGGKAQGRRQRIRRMLEHRRWTWPLFDRQLQVRGLETSFRLMWEIYAAGLAPQHVVVSNSPNSRSHV